MLENGVTHYLYRLVMRRPDFPADMTEDEASAMERHFGYWADLVERGGVLVYGPVPDPAGTWGMAVVEATSEDEVKAIAHADPAVIAGLGRVDVIGMPHAIVPGGARRA